MTREQLLAFSKQYHQEIISWIWMICIALAVVCSVIDHQIVKFRDRALRKRAIRRNRPMTLREKNKSETDKTFSDE